MSDSTFYCIGTVAGPHPYPMLVRDFQSIIGRETREQMLAAEGRLPDSLVACIGGGSNAMGLFHPFLDERGIEIYGVEAAGHGLDSGEHAASIAGGRPGVLHGNRTYLLMNEDGQINEAHSISAGLDYPGIGPEHSWLHDVGRVTFLSATDDEALNAFQLLSKLEGIIPALEPAHAIAKVLELAPTKAEGSPDGGQSLRPRRQGPRYGRAASAKQSVDDRTHRPPLRRAQRRRPRRAGDLHHGRRSGLRDFARDPRGAARCRRRRDRARHAVHRSDGGRPGDSGRGPARARSPART